MGRPVLAAHSIPQRISVVGSTGSGKTYLARRLSRRLGVPLVELDLVQQACSRSGGNTDEEFARAVMSAVTRDSWIIDGHYRSIRDLVWREADLVVHLDYPLSVILRQLITRYLAKQRSELPETRAQGASPISPGAAVPEPERANWRKRLRRVGKTIAERREYRQVLAQIEDSDVRWKRFTSSAAAEAWLQSL